MLFSQMSSSPISDVLPRKCEMLSTGSLNSPSSSPVVCAKAKPTRYAARSARHAKGIVLVPRRLPIVHDVSHVCKA